MEAISRDFNDQCAKVLSSQRLLYLDYPSFDRVTTTAMEVFAAWEENIKEFTNVAREGERRIPLTTTIEADNRNPCRISHAKANGKVHRR